MALQQKNMKLDGEVVTELGRIKEEHGFSDNQLMENMIERFQNPKKIADKSKELEDVINQQNEFIEKLKKELGIDDIKDTFGVITGLKNRPGELQSLIELQKEQINNAIPNNYNVVTLTDEAIQKIVYAFLNICYNEKVNKNIPKEISNKIGTVNTFICFALDFFKMQKEEVDFAKLLLSENKTTFTEYFKSMNNADRIKTTESKQPMQ